MKLYHGTTASSINKPDLSLCRDNTDFGKGFYTTTDLVQANKWALLKKNRLHYEDAFIMEYEFDERILQMQTCKVLRFNGANEEWLKFVFNNRRGILTETYDIVMGPVANDSLYATLLLYEQGVLSVNATIEQLKTHKLFNQLSFHTVKSLETLNFIKSVKVE
jgi:hypothetical protein